MRRFAWCLPLAVLWCFGTAPAEATEVELAGVFGSKVVLIIDGAVPRTLAVGEQTAAGVRVVDVRNGGATVEVDGQRRQLALGAGPVRLTSGVGASEAGATTVNLHADSKGHHFTSGSINGAAMRFLVDTGASMVSMGLSDARRAGIDYLKGEPGIGQTASGPVRVWRVRLDTVRIGEVTLYGVDGLVHENDLPFVLLGMSFLSRMDMQHEGSRLILRKRF